MGNGRPARAAARLAHSLGDERLAVPYTYGHTDTFIRFLCNADFLADCRLEIQRLSMSSSGIHRSELFRNCGCLYSTNNFQEKESLILKYFCVFV